ncbi:MAG: hypothetical protein H0T12_02870 [Actinobacteria bacterium]|nr:hypothetical protein [Actinomycetota bacterium]
MPLLAWLAMFTRWSEGERTRVVVAATAGYTGLVAVGVLQALTGNAPLSLSLVMALLFWASAGLLLGAFLVTGAGLMRARRGSNQATGLQGAAPG